MAEELRLEGLDQTMARFNELQKRAQKGAVRRSLRKAANVVRDAAKNNAKQIDDPVTREKIWKNISTQSGKTRDNNAIKMRVGVRGGAAVNQHSKDADMSRLSGGDTRHFRYIELGTVNTPATPFLRPALSSNINKATEKFIESFKAEIANL